MANTVTKFQYEASKKKSHENSTGASGAERYDRWANMVYL
jgi:hypothetical protein